MSRTTVSSGINLRGITKSYGRTPILHGLDLEVAPGEFVTMLGPSGSGKTTVLKIIAGFEQPDSGSVLLAGRDVTSVPPEHRNIGVVFQNYSLFPHMDVAGNVDFPLRMRNIPKGPRRARVSQALARVALTGYESHKPHQLSGGQQQRVAIARAIVYEPDVLLMDEPLGALDRRLREEMQLEIKSLHEQLGITIVYVTHDQDEALSLSDRIVVFNKGRIEQIGVPRVVYRNPETPFVADFFGDSLSISAVVHERQARLEAVGATIELPAMRTQAGGFRLLWRSDQTSICNPVDQVRQDGTVIIVSATVLTSAYGGNAMRLRVRLVTGDIGILTVAEDSTLAAGTRIGVVLDLAIATYLAIDRPGVDAM